MYLEQLPQFSVRVIGSQEGHARHLDIDIRRTVLQTLLNHAICIRGTKFLPNGLAPILEEVDVSARKQSLQLFPLVCALACQEAAVSVRDLTHTNSYVHKFAARNVANIANHEDLKVARAHRLAYISILETCSNATVKRSFPMSGPGLIITNTRVAQHRQRFARGVK
jgi:hypothetical protein